MLKGKSLLEDSAALGVAVETAFFNHVFTRYYRQSIGFSYWGVVAGSKILREYSITPGRIEGHGKRAKVLPRLSSHATS